MNKGYKFVRFGGLSPVNQKGYTTEYKSTHQPPARRGLYAMPYNKIEMYLINAQKPDGSPSDYAEYVKDKNGRPIVGTINLWIKSELDFENGIKEGSKISRCRHKYEPKAHIYSFGKWKNFDIKRYRKDDNYDYDFNDEDFLGAYFLKLKKPKRFEYNGDIWCHLDVFCKIPETDILEKKFSWIKLSMKNYLKYLRIADNNNKRLMKNEHIRNSNDYFEVFIEHIK